MYGRHLTNPNNIVPQLLKVLFGLVFGVAESTLYMFVITFLN